MSYLLRRIQITGGSTYIVSLPKSWVKSMGLKPGDYVQLIPQPDDSLLLVAGRKTSEPLEARIEASPDDRPEEIARELIACYLAGYDMIRVSFTARVDEFKYYLKNLMRTKLIGLESIEESANHMVIRCLVGHVDFPIKEVLNRMHIMTLSMCMDSLKALRERNELLANDIIQRDDEVDRFYLFCVRQLKAAVENALTMGEIGLKNPRECLGYRLIIKSMERIADHATSIACQIPLIKIRGNSQILDGIIRLGEAVLSIYEKAMDSVFRMDVKQANKVISEVENLAKLENGLVKKIFESKLNTETAVGLRLILESIKRIAEYSADIAEIVINLGIKS
ncbi:MAG: phosphate uptake regulator PhoU [Thaumarchaeota archaeon]|nr:MAG: phosphate uptake regulator PhoU [Nitrososphaerota archaeon]